MRQFIVLFIFWMLILPVAGQDRSEKLLSLSDAVQTAFDQNPDINRLRIELQQKQLAWKTAMGTSDLEWTFSREGLSDRDPGSFFEERMEINQEFDFPLTIYYRQKKINKEKAALELKLKALEKEITKAVKQYYIEVLYGKYLRELRTNELALSKDLLDAVLARVEGGVGTGIDQLAAEIRLLESENELNDAIQLFHEARYALFQYLGLNPEDQTYNIRFADTLFSNSKLIQQEEALHKLTAQPLYQSLEASVQAGYFNIKEARSNYLPDLRLGYLVQQFNTDYRYSGFVLGLKIPIWGAFRQRGEVQQALLQQQSDIWSQQATLLDLKKRIEYAWHGYETSITILDRYNDLMKIKSDSLLKLTLEAYQLGQIDLLKVIDAQSLYLITQKRYLEAVRSYYLKLAELEEFLDVELVY